MSSITYTWTLNHAELIRLNLFLESSSCAKRLMHIKGNLTWLHGFLCAMLSLPHQVHSTDWQAIVFGADFAFRTAIEKNIEQLFIRLVNMLKLQLNGVLPFKFLLWDNNQLIEYEACTSRLLAVWCEGYLEGAKLVKSGYRDRLLVANLFPFRVLAGATEKVDSNHQLVTMIQNAQQYQTIFKANLWHYVKTNYRYWKIKHNMPTNRYQHDELSTARKLH